MRMSSFSIILFFIFLANAILSFWVPNLLTDIFKSPAKVGLIISFSSLIGFLADITLPQILRGISVRALVLWAIVGIFVFALLLFFGMESSLILIFLLAMGIWGIYYEFVMFSEQQYISDTIPYRSHSASWALLDIFKNLGYLLGPIIGGYLIIFGGRGYIYSSVTFAGIALIILVFSKKLHSRPVEIDFSKVNILKEVEHWVVLFKTVWPVVTLSIFLGLIDAAFWTTGVIWTEKLMEESFFGMFLIPAYQLPSLFMGLVVARWSVVHGKKRLALQYFLIASIFLAALGLTSIVPLLIFMVFMASVMLSVTYPMIEAVYSNILARMGRERGHLIGLSSSAGSISYIIGPALCGYIASLVGEGMTFLIVGAGGIIVALLLFLVTPKKLKLPQTQIATWED